MINHTIITLGIVSALLTYGNQTFANTTYLPEESSYNNNAPLYSSNIESRLADQDKDGVIDGRDLCSGTPIGAKVDNNGCPTSSAKLLSLNLKVLFDSGKSDVKSTFYSQIKKLADFLKTHPESNVQINGYTDNIGNAQYNLALSQRRASAITDVLIKTFAISPNRVKAVGHGQNNPIDTNNTAQGREHNRRVVAEVYAKERTQKERWTIYSVDNQQTKNTR